jgi:hypothetical protein
MFVFDKNFKKGDYIINRTSGDIAILEKYDDRGYMHFKHYYGAMFDSLKDCKKYTMHNSYQKFYDLCNEDEKKKMDGMVKEKGGK